MVSRVKLCVEFLVSLAVLICPEFLFKVYFDHSRKELGNSTMPPRCFPSLTRTDRPETIVASCQPHIQRYCKESMYLANIFIPYSADLLNIGSTLRNVFQRVTSDCYLVLLVF